MTRGRVRVGPEPLIPITIHGRPGRLVEAVLDTGYTASYGQSGSAPSNQSRVRSSQSASPWYGAKRR